jgi:hypothetical protein
MKHYLRDEKSVMYQGFNNAQLQKEDEQVTLEMNTKNDWR